MSKIIQCTGTNKMPVGIPVGKITGITCVSKSMDKCCGNCFIAIEPDSSDGVENGWYVEEEYSVVLAMIDSALGSE